MSIQNGSMQRVQLPLSWEHQLPSPSLTVQGRGGFLKDRRGYEMSPLATAESWDMGEENEEIPCRNSSLSVPLVCNLINYC